MRTHERRIRLAWGLGLGAWLLIAGCATVPAPPARGTVNSPMPGREPEPVKGASGANTSAPEPVPTPPTGSGTPMGTTASGGTITQNAPVARDSTPSADAQAVLQTIPDPLTPGEAARAPAIATASDTLETAAIADTASAPRDSADVPIPSLTQPLGDRPGARAPADTMVSAPSSPPPAAPAKPPASGTAAPTSPDSCWRVQVAAVPEAARAASLRDAAQSQLWLTMVVETEKGLHKVRTQGCLTADGAERLKQRAIAAGFSGAFRFRRQK